MPSDPLNSAPLLSTRCPVGVALGIIGGKWKPRILAILGERTRRFRELEADGVVDRRVYPQLPLRVEYSLGSAGVRALPVLRALEEFGLSMIAARGAKSTAQHSA